jgi:iron complex transport system ATP-binding protein
MNASVRPHSALALRDLSVRYTGATHRALDGVTLNATRGVITAIVGPNGSGKSTIVRTLLQRIVPEHGTICIGGTLLGELHPREFARRVAVVAQREEVQMPLPVRDFIAMGRHVHRGPFTPLTAHDRTLIEHAMERAGMHHLAHRTTDTLSGGEWQRVRIARALAQDAPLLVLDEPTTFLDIAHEMAVFELLHALAAEGHAILLISHQLNLVARFADHLVLLHHGRVAASGTAAEVMRGDILERVYEWPLVVTRDPAVGAFALLPLRKPADVRARNTSVRDA